MLLKDLKLIFHEKRLLIPVAVLLLATAAAVFFASPRLLGEKVRVGIADNDGSRYSELIVSYFEENEVFSSYIELIRGSEAEVERMFDEGRTDLYLVIPENFAERLMYIDNVPIRAVINSADKTRAIVYRNMLDAYARYISAIEVNCQGLYDIMTDEGFSDEEKNDVNNRISLELIFTAMDKDSVFEVIESDRFAGISVVNYYIYSLLSLLLLYIGLLAGLGICDEKLLGTEDRLKSMGGGAVRAVLSKSLAFTFTGGAAVVIAMALMNISGGTAFSFTAFACALLYIFVPCLVFCVIAELKVTRGSYLIIGNMAILLMFICGGGAIPTMYLPEAITKIARFSPVYRFIKILL